MTTDDPQRSHVVAVLRHRNDVYGESTARNAVAALEQARLDHLDWDISDPLPERPAVSAILICTEHLSRAAPNTAAVLERYVKAGGSVVVLHRGLHDDYCDLFGILRQDRFAAVTPDYDTSGLHFPSGTLPSFAGLKLDASVADGHASFDVVPVESARVVATAWTGKPLAWRIQLGSGYVLYWNTTIFSRLRSRGLIIESLLCVVPICVVPMANAGVVQVDDFPAPLASPPAELAGTPKTDQFFGRVWWPDVYRLAERYGVAISCFALFDYSDFTTDGHKNPFSMIDSENWMAIKRLPPAEIGLHGYNHLPLAKSFWRDQAQMAQCLERAVAEWQKAGLGPLPTSYVPPMNLYDQDGIAALAEAIPGLQTISGAPRHNMGGATEREFGPEPWNETLFNLPRATCGSEGSLEYLFDCSSEVAALGVWTHYLHPDDLMDVPQPGKNAELLRNPHARSWRGKGGRRGLYDQLDAIFANVKSRFPWLIYRTTTDAAATVKAFLESEWRTQISVDRVVIECPVGGFFRFRTNGTPPDSIVACKGAEILHQDSAEDFNFYVLKAQAAKVEITLGKEVRPTTRLERIVAALRPERPALAGQ